MCWEFPGYFSIYYYDMDLMCKKKKIKSKSVVALNAGSWFGNINCMACYRWKLPFYIEKHEVSVDNLWTSGMTRKIFQVFFGLGIAISRM